MIHLRPFTLTALVVLAWTMFAPSLRGQGTVDVTIEEWQVPNRAYPHDPAFAPDGSAWYTGQRNNTLGRLDVRTGQIRKYPLPTHASGPNGLVADRHANRC